MQARLVELSAPSPSSPAHRLHPHDIVPAGRVAHDNYARFMTQHLHASLAPVLSGDPRHAALLDRIATADVRIARAMAELEGGRCFSRWLPGARAPYRRELSVGHYMTAVADELGSLAAMASHAVPGVASKRGARTDAERVLLRHVASFLTEFKRSVRSASIPHVNDDYCAELARRFDAHDEHGRAQPGQEQTTTSGGTLRVGAGIAAHDGASLTAGCGLRVVRTDRHAIDLDRDDNIFAERSVAAELRLGLKAKVVSAELFADLTVSRGLYFEGATTKDTLRVAGLHEWRGGHPCAISAGPAHRSAAEVQHGVAASVRKLVGGGSGAPYDSPRWASAAKEEKGRHNRSLIQRLAGDIEDAVEALARVRGIEPPPGRLHRAAVDHFPCVADQIERYRRERMRRQLGEQFTVPTGSARTDNAARPTAAAEPTRPTDSAELTERTEVRRQPTGQVGSAGNGDAPYEIDAAIGMASEPLSVPAMVPRPGAPWDKKPYTGHAASASVSASLGLTALASVYGSSPLRRAAARVAHLLPSIGGGYGVGLAGRRLQVCRQLPISAALAPATIFDFSKGVMAVDEVAAALALRMPVDAATAGSAGGVRPLDHAHPALAVLMRYEEPVYRARAASAGAGLPYLATLQRMLTDGHIDNAALLGSTRLKLASFEDEYEQLLADAHAAKEAQRCGDRLGLHTLLDSLNKRHWSGWNSIHHGSSVRELEVFLAHTIAMHQLAFVRLKYVATMAKLRLPSSAPRMTRPQIDDARAQCTDIDRRVMRIDKAVTALKPPMLPNTFDGLSFGLLETEAARRSRSSTSSFVVSAGLGATVSALAGGFTWAGLRGPELRVDSAQTFTTVTTHPNQLRSGSFHSFTLSIRGGVGARTVCAAAERALREACRKGRIGRAFYEGATRQLKRDVDALFGDAPGSLALPGRSSGVVIELNYGRPLALSSEAPVPYLRFARLYAQTSYDNSVRAPNLLAATGLPVQLAPGVIDTATTTTVSRTINGSNVRHLLLDYAGSNGIRALLKPQGDAAAFDGESARAVLLEPINAGLREAWFHSGSPVVDIVEKFMKHHCRARRPAGSLDDSGGMIDPADEFAYIEMDNETTRRVAREEPALRRAAAGSSLDPFAVDVAPTRRQQLSIDADAWQRDGSVSESALQRVRERLASLRTDEDRIDFLTRDGEGIALLAKCIRIMDTYSTWAAMLRTVVGYEGRPNKASIDLLSLRRPVPAEAAGAPGAFLHARKHGKAPENAWL